MCIIYLACPYTHDDPNVREQRYHIANQAAAALIGKGHIVFSPITMTHPLDVILSDEGQTLGSDYWVKFDEAFMDACSECVVLRVLGWEQSSGVRREMEYFKLRNKAVHFFDRFIHGKPEQA